MNCSNLPETAPEGFVSNYAALRALLRFGPAIMTTSELLVMLFHVERSTVVGRSSDQHSWRDAHYGVYSVREGYWVRGPAGVSKKTWRRANASLIRSGFLEMYRRHNWHGRNAATEYVVVWPKISQAIRDWKENQSEARGVFFIEHFEMEKGA